ncbi:hypothetical protein ACFWY5_49140 [Nonomuraea sp. NPDC059007]
MRACARFAKLAQAPHPVTAATRNLVTRMIPAKVFHAAVERTLGWTPPA